jgi:transposase
MIGSTRRLTVHVFGRPVDMRKGFDMLSALVTEELQHDVLAGDVYLFVGYDRKRAKVLLWDGTGLCVYAKRLETGHFTAPWRTRGRVPGTMTMSELALFLEGTELCGRLPLSPTPFTFETAPM